MNVRFQSTGPDSLEAERIEAMMEAVLKHSSRTTVIASCGLSVNVPTAVLQLSSRYLSSVMATSPACQDRVINIPDCSLPALHQLVQLLTKPSATQVFLSADVLSLAENLGINLKPRKGDKQYTIDVKKEKENASDSEGIDLNILESLEKSPNHDFNENNKSLPCERCDSSFTSPEKLAVHYCMNHFFMDMRKAAKKSSTQSGENSCAKCKQQLPNKRKLIEHLGVKHDLINVILIRNRLQPIPNLSSHGADISKHEDDTRDEDSDTILRRTSIIASLPLNSEPTQEETNLEENVNSVENTSENTMDSFADKSDVENINKSASEENELDEQFKNLDKILSKSSGRQQPATEGKSLSSSAKRPGKVQNGVKNIYICQICEERNSKADFENLSSLKNHLVTSHFKREIRAMFDCYQNKKCLTCGKKFNSNQAVYLHIGSKHNRVSEILKRKGLRPLKPEIVFELRNTEGKIKTEI